MKILIDSIFLERKIVTNLQWETPEEHLDMLIKSPLRSARSHPRGYMRNNSANIYGASAHMWL